MTREHNVTSHSTTELPTCSEEGQIITINLLNKVAYRYYRIVVESVPGLLRDEFVILRDIKMFAVAGNQVGNKFGQLIETFSYHFL